MTEPLYVSVAHRTISFSYLGIIEWSFGFGTIIIHTMYFTQVIVQF